MPDSLTDRRTLLRRGTALTAAASAGLAGAAPLPGDAGHDAATPGASPAARDQGGTMRLFADSLHQEFATWALGFAPYGGCDVGEVIAIAADVPDGDDSAFYAAWAGFADRLAAEADAALAAGHRQSARAGYLHAACYYGLAYHPLYGAPPDPRLLAAFGKEMAAFDQAMALSNPPVERIAILFEGHAMPAYFIPAAGHAGERRPLVIGTNGYDATVVDMYFAFGAAAVARGFHCLFFDGPG